jgi:hypothetical protein
LLVPETIRAGWVTCPRCLKRIPNPAISESSPAAGDQALALDAEVRRDARGLGCGIALLLALLSLGVAFLWSFGLAATKTAGRYGDNLLVVWFGVGGIGAVLVLILASISTTRFLFRRIPETAETTRGERRILQTLAVIGALFIGAVAGVVVVGLTCAAVLGGATAGGWK